jgi:hypothetical protein
VYLAATKNKKVTPTLILAGKGTMTTIDTYTQGLLVIATEQPDSWTTESRQLLRKAQPPDLPPTFLTSLFTMIAANKLPITREGTERLMDALFENPAFMPLLTDPEAQQTQLAAAILLPTTTSAFQSFWTHIIVPAWNQHADLHRLLAETTEK